jgi:hypothetical protein
MYVAGFFPRNSLIDPGNVHERFMVEKVIKEQGSVEVLGRSLLKNHSICDACSPIASITVTEKCDKPDQYYYYNL